MDLRLPDISGIDALSAILAEFPDGAHRDADDVRGRRRDPALARRRRARLPAEEHAAERSWSRPCARCTPGRKRIPQEIAAQLAEHIADERLTEREVDVLQHVAGGNRNEDIAELLSISEETVKVHVKHIMEKLGASDRTAAVAIAVRRGIIQL